MAFHDFYIIMTICAGRRSLICRHSPERPVRDGGEAALIDKAAEPVIPEQQGAVNVDEVTDLREDVRGCHRERGAAHTADHNAEPLVTGSPGEQEPVRQAAALVELYVDHLIPLCSQVQFTQVQAGFITTQR